MYNRSTQNKQKSSQISSINQKNHKKCRKIQATESSKVREKERETTSGFLADVSVETRTLHHGCLIRLKRRIWKRREVKKLRMSEWTESNPNPIFILPFLYGQAFIIIFVFVLISIIYFTSFVFWTPNLKITSTVWSLVFWFFYLELFYNLLFLNV